MKLSIMFFGADDVADGSQADKYADILNIAQEADRLGFHAVWFPERHFQRVGQVFPNPAVLAAAVSSVTERIRIRAGSIVTPLHHPVRLIEDWAAIDNLSRGRVGISLASGWHAADFVLAPERYSDRRVHTEDTIPLLRKLWRGEAVEFTDGVGQKTPVVPQPRPVSAELPLWLTTSSSAATWEVAGRNATGVLGATLGQTRQDLLTRINAYRAAISTDGNRAPNDVVTLMVHTYVGETDEDVRQKTGETLRKYLKSYLRQRETSKIQSVWDEQLRNEADFDMLAEFAFERYLSWGSLLGSAQACRSMIADLAEMGCDELACFVDFGLTREDIVASLHRLSALRTGLSGG